MNSIFFVILATSLKVFLSSVIAAAIFRIPLRLYLMEFMGLSLFVSFLAKILVFLNINIVFIDILFLVMVYIFNLVFLRLSHWHSFLFVFVGYIFSEVLDVFIYLGFTDSIPDDVENKMGLNEKTLILLLINGMVTTAISVIFYKFRLGFVFITEKMDNKPGLKLINSIIIISVLISISAIFTIIITQKLFFTTVIMMVVFYILAFLYTYILVKKENKDYEKYYAQKMDFR